jgi:hypothetical protein
MKDLVWVYYPWFPRTNRWEHLCHATFKIKYGYRYFIISTRRVFFLSYEYEVSTWTEEGPSDCCVVSLRQLIGVFKDCNEAKRECLYYL